MRTNIIAVAAMLALATHAEPPADPVADAVRNAVLKAEHDRLVEAGITDIPVDDLPDALVRSRGLEPGTSISVEQFLDPAFQDALLKHGTALPEREGVFEPSAEMLADPAVLEAIRDRFGPNATVLTDPGVVAAFREAQDRDALQASLAELLGDTFQLADSHDVGLPVDSIPWERLPTAEVLDRLTPEDRRLLKPYRDLLDDHWALSDAMPEMTADQREAATRFLGRMRRGSGEPGLGPEPALAPTPRGSALLATLRQVDSGITVAGEHGAVLPTTRDEFAELVDRRPLVRVPTTYLQDDSDNHVLPGIDQATRIFSKSTFGNGALLLVEQSDADAFHPHDPNLTIADRPGTVTTTQYADGKWSTTVAGFDGRRVHHVTVEAKLEDAERQAFVRFATTLIEEAGLLP